MNKWLRLTILLLATIVFVVSAYKLIVVLIEYKAGQNEYSYIADMAVLPVEDKETKAQSIADEVEEEETKINKNEMRINHEILLDVNDEYKAWINIKDTNINYPILQAADNDYYLTYTFQRTYNSAGSIFIDANIETGMAAKNVIVHGHNMNDASMFGDLKKYRDRSFLDANKTFQIYTPKGNYDYEIFAVYVVSNSNVEITYQYGYDSDEIFLETINKLKNYSLHDTDVEILAEDKIMTLSTCTNNGSQRLVVIGKQIPME
jgi:sortase, SrtB family